MTGTRRALLIETLLILVLVALLLGVWWWQEGRRAAALTAAREAHASDIAELTRRAAFWAEGLVAGEAEAVLEAFAAGISPAVLAGRQDSIQIAAGALLELRGIAFVHVLRPDGAVLYSSDRKLAAAGLAGERGSWALTTVEVTSRESDIRGVTEIAAPIYGADDPLAYLWIGYRTEEVAQELRPEAL